MLPASVLHQFTSHIATFKARMYHCSIHCSIVFEFELFRVLLYQTHKCLSYDVSYSACMFVLVFLCVQNKYVLDKKPFCSDCSTWHRGLYCVKNGRKACTITRNSEYVRWRNQYMKTRTEAMSNHCRDFTGLASSITTVKRLLDESIQEEDHPANGENHYERVANYTAGIRRCFELNLIYSEWTLAARHGPFWGFCWATNVLKES